MGTSILNKLVVFADGYRPPQSPFYQLPPKVQHYPSSQLLLSPTPPGLQQLLGELTKTLLSVVLTRLVKLYIMDRRLGKFGVVVKELVVQGVHHSRVCARKTNTYFVFLSCYWLKCDINNCTLVCLVSEVRAPFSQQLDQVSVVPSLFYRQHQSSIPPVHGPHEDSSVPLQPAAAFRAREGNQYL